MGKKCRFGMGMGLSALIAVSVMLLFATAAVSAETVVSIENASALPNTETTVSIIAHDVTNLTQFGIKLEYNASVVNATSAVNNPNLPDMFLGESLNDFSHASEGWVFLACNPTEATPVSGDEVVLTTLTLHAVGTREEDIPPDIEFIPPTPGNDSINTTGCVNVTVNVTDSSGVSTVFLNWNGENESMLYMIGNDTWSTWTLNKTNLSSGDYTYKVYANDTAEKTSSLDLQIGSLKDNEGNAILSADPVNGTFTIPGNMGMSGTRVLTVMVGLPKTGNIDGINEVSMDDAVYLARHVLAGEMGPELYPLHADGNVDSEDEVSLDDAVYLARHVLAGEMGPELYPLYP